MSEQQILEEVIIAYRKIIVERYQYKQLNQRYELPTSFNETRTTLFKEYFLKHIYPAPTKRKELDEAFQNLDNYIKHPEKLLRILIDSSRLLFKYGRHLPKILKAGLSALRSFRTATDFEKKLVNNAIASSITPPFTTADIEQLIASLSQKDIQQFIVNNQSMFEFMHDRKLIEKIIEIVEHLISKMKKRPNIYTEIEVKALVIGRDLIVEGNKLFDQLPEKDRQLILDLTVQIEKDALEQIFAQAQKNK